MLRFWDPGENSQWTLHTDVKLRVCALLRSIKKLSHCLELGVKIRVLSRGRSCMYVYIGIDPRKLSVVILDIKEGPKTKIMFKHADALTASAEL